MNLKPDKDTVELAKMMAMAHLPGFIALGVMLVLHWLGWLNW